MIRRGSSTRLRIFQRGARREGTSEQEGIEEEGGDEFDGEAQRQEGEEASANELDGLAAFDCSSTRRRRPTTLDEFFSAYGPTRVRRLEMVRNARRNHVQIVDVVD